MFLTRSWEYCLMQVELTNIFLGLILSLQGLSASQRLLSSRGGKNLLDDLSELTLAVNANDFDIERIISLLKAVLSKKSHYVIWDKVYSVITQSTPPRPPPIPPYSRPIFPSDVKNTPNYFNSGGLQNKSEPVEKVRGVVCAQFKS